MAEVQEGQIPSFMKTGDFWRQEISGLIARLNDAASVVDVAIDMPPTTDDVVSLANRNEKIQQFHIEFRRLYMSSKDILKYDIIRDVDKWISACSNSKTIKNVDLIREGLKLSARMQSYYYDIGIKDIDIKPPTEFPFAWYKRGMINGTGT